MLLNRSSTLTPPSSENYTSFPVTPRCVKLLTGVSNKICGHYAREGYIASKLKSRSVMPDFSKKSDFKFVVGMEKKK